MPYCEKCMVEQPQGNVYCKECGSRLKGTERPSFEIPETGTKGGEAGAEMVPTPSVPTRAFRRPADVWRSVPSAGKLVGAGAILAIIGFFIPSTTLLAPGLAITRSLAMIGGAFLLIPLLSIVTIVLVFLASQDRQLSNRLYIDATMIAIGAFVLPVALIVWRTGLVGGLLVFLGFIAVIGGGYGLISDAVRNLR